MPQRNESTRSRARIHAKLFAATLPWGDAAIAALCSDHEGALLIDQMPYEKLFALMADLAPTLVPMEPCGSAKQTR